MIPFILAVTISLSNPPSSLNYQQESSVDVGLNCSSCGNSYMRAVFFKDGKTGYFGYTKDASSNWVNTTADKTAYFPVLKTDLIEGSWSGKLSFKPDYDSNYFEGAGEYRFKIGRYTSADSSALWSDSYPITLLAPTSTPSPSPTSTPIPPTHTPKPASTSTPKPIPTNTPKPANTSTPKAVPTPTAVPKILSAYSVAPSDTPPLPSITPTIKSEAVVTKNIAPTLFIISGLIVLGYVAYRVY